MGSRTESRPSIGRREFGAEVKRTSPILGTLTPLPWNGATSLRWVVTALVPLPSNRTRP